MHNISFFNTILIILVCLLMLSACSSESTPDTETAIHSFQWNKEESYLVDYTIVEDAIYLRYLFCFENNTDSNVLIKYPGAKFSFFDLLGWMEYKSVFPGICENGETSFVVKSGEKKEIILIFKGGYTGGVVKENLKVSSIVLMQD